MCSLKCFRLTVAFRMSGGRRKLSCKFPHVPKRTVKLLQRMGLHQEICVKAAVDNDTDIAQGKRAEKSCFYETKQAPSLGKGGQGKDSGGKLVNLLLIPDKEIKGDLVLLHIVAGNVSRHKTVPDTVLLGH